MCKRPVEIGQRKRKGNDKYEEKLVKNNKEYQPVINNKKSVNNIWNEKYITVLI